MARYNVGGILLKRKIVLLIALLIFVTSCSSENDSQEDKTIFLYKGSSLGDRDYASAILNMLPYQEDAKGFARYTDENLIIAEYASKTKEAARKIVLTNATYIFNLIEGVDKIIFKFQERRYSIHKEELTKWYMSDKYLQISKKKELKNLIEKNLNDSQRVKTFFEK
ncbi:hypothetical protein [Virgibacillus sp. L01]|uniref:hypothetical protein n=1 Tax=Virgibacillus sp. L01 TaxID=3457429 RepID=UPI003FCFD6D2